MAFTIEQNLQGAGAYEPAQSPSQGQLPLGLALSGVAATLTDSFVRTNARSSGITQNDRDDAIFSKLTSEAKSDIAAGMSLDDAAQKYSVPFANLSVNDEQKAVLTNIFKGEDIFYTPAQPMKPQDVALEAWNRVDVDLRLARTNKEVADAARNGEKINFEEGQNRAINIYIKTVAQSQASVVAGNQNFGVGFEGNIKTLDGISDAVQQVLSVERRGGNFDIGEVQQLYTTYQQLSSQPAFSEPVGGTFANQWSMMKRRKENIENLFTTLEDYDLKAATQQATALMAGVALSDSDNAMLPLAVKSPDMMTDIAVKIQGDISTIMADYAKAPKTIFSDLNIDPEVLELMSNGFTGTEKDILPPDDTAFPQAVSETHKDIIPVGTEQPSEDFSARVLANQKVINAYPIEIVDTPEGVDAYASDITEQSFLLSKVNSPSGPLLDTLFSDKNIKTLKRLEAKGGKDAEIANTLRAFMGTALKKSSAEYKKRALGLVANIPNVTMDMNTGEWNLENNPFGAKVNAFASRFGTIDGKALFTVPELLAMGGNARAIVQSKLIAAGKVPRITPSFFNNNQSRAGVSDDAPTAFKEFWAMSEILKTPEWLRTTGQFEIAKGIPERTKQLKGYYNLIKVFNIDDVQTETLPSEPPAEVEVTQGTKEDPWVIANEEAYTMVPVGAHYIAAGDPTQTVRIKKGR